jgi:hypothetical protein
MPMRLLARFSDQYTVLVLAIHMAWKKKNSNSLDTVRRLSIFLLLIILSASTVERSQRGKWEYLGVFPTKELTTANTTGHNLFKLACQKQISRMLDAILSSNMRSDWKRHLISPLE